MTEAIIGGSRPVHATRSSKVDWPGCTLSITEADSSLQAGEPLRGERDLVGPGLVVEVAMSAARAREGV